MFAGSILSCVMRMVAATIEDVAVAGSAVACYLIGRFIGNPGVFLVGLAVAGGGIAVWLVGTAGVQLIEWTPPELVRENKQERPPRCRGDL